MSFYKYDYIGPFRDGVAIAIEKSWKMLHIDEDGRPLYKERYNWVWNFDEGVARVMKNGEWWHIDLEGKALYKERFDFIPDYQKGDVISAIAMRRRFNMALTMLIPANILLVLALIL